MLSTQEISGCTPGKHDKGVTTVVLLNIKKQGLIQMSLGLNGMCQSLVMQGREVICDLSSVNKIVFKYVEVQEGCSIFFFCSNQRFITVYTISFIF